MQTLVDQGLIQFDFNLTGTNGEFIKESLLKIMKIPVTKKQKNLIYLYYKKYKSNLNLISNINKPNQKTKEIVDSLDSRRSDQIASENTFVEEEFPSSKNSNYIDDFEKYFSPTKNTEVFSTPNLNFVKPNPLFQKRSEKSNFETSDTNNIEEVPSDNIRRDPIFEICNLERNDTNNIEKLSSDNKRDDIEKLSVVESKEEVSVSPKANKKRNRVKKIIKVVKNDSEDISKVDLGIDAFEQFCEPLNKNEVANIPFIVVKTNLKRFINASKAGISTLEHTFYLDKQKLDVINNYVSNGFGHLHECLTFFYRIEYRKFNNLCVINFTGNSDRKQYSKYARCAHYTCRSYHFKATGDLESSLKVEVFVRTNFNTDLVKNKKVKLKTTNGIVHTNYKLAGQIRAISRKLLQKKLVNKTPHEFLVTHRVQVPMQLKDQGKREDISDEQVRGSKH